MWAGSSQGQGQGSPHGQAAAKAKAKACSSQGQGSPPWACSIQGLGMQQARPRPRPRQPPWACGRQGQGQGTQPRPWHACVGTLACPWWQAARPLGAPQHARCLRGRGSTAWARGRGAGMPRGWDAKAVACPWDPSKAMAALGGSAAAKPS